MATRHPGGSIGEGASSSRDLELPKPFRHEAASNRDPDDYAIRARRAVAVQMGCTDLELGTLPCSRINSEPEPVHCL
jgi:hypothetical protein